MRIRIGLLSIFIAGLFALLFAGSCSCSGDEQEIEFECDTHDHCLDDEACIGEVCVDFPEDGEECPEGYEGERLDDIECVDGVWTDVPAPPVVESISADPPTADPEGTIELSVDVASALDADELIYEWSVADEDWELVDDDAAAVELIASPRFDASTTVDVEVSDRFGGSDAAEITVSTHEPDGPQIQSIEADPQPAMPADVQHVEADVVYPSDVEVSYEWSIPAGWEPAGDDDDATIDVIAPDEHEVSGNIELTVTDNLDREVVASTMLSTMSNPGPVIEDIYAEEGTVLSPGASTEIVVEATHEHDYELYFEWQSDDTEEQWELEDSSEDTALLVAPDEYEATVEITAEAVDTYGASATETIELSTAEPGEPVIEDFYADENPMEINATTELHVEVYNPAQYEIDYTWSLESEEGDWVLDADEDSATLTATDVYGADAEVTVVLDGEFEQLEESLTVRTLTDENEPPIIEAMWADETELLPNEHTMVYVDAVDPFGLEISYDWSLDGDEGWEIVGGQQDEAIELAAPDAYESSVEVTVVVEDEEEESTEHSLVVTTLEQQAPTIDEAWVEKAVLAPEETTEAYVEASHPYDLELGYEWEIDGAGWELEGDDTAADVTVVASDDHNAEATLTIEVTDADGETATESLSLYTTAEENQPPVIDAVVVEETPIQPESSTQVTVEAYDPFGLALEYEWTLDSEEEWSIVGDDDTAAIEVEAPQQMNSEVVVTVEVTDEEGESATDSATVETIVNDGPVLDAEVSAQEDPLRPEATTYVEVEASHPQQLALDYQWTLDSTEEWSIVGDENSAMIELQAPNVPSSEVDITVEVVDEYGESVSSATTVHTIDNDGPTIDEEVSAEDDPVWPDETTTVEVVASHPQDFDIEYDWTLQSAEEWSIVGDEDSASIELQAPNAPGSEVDITVEVVDEYEESVSSSMTIYTVANGGPNIDEEVSAEQDPVRPDDTTNVDVVASHPQDFDIEYRWSIESSDNWTITDVDDATTQIGAPDTPNSQATVTVEVIDEYEESVSSSTTVYTIDNDGPEVTLVAGETELSPEDTTTVTADVDHPQNFVIADYQWSDDNDETQAHWEIEQQNGSLEVTAPYATDEALYIEVTVVDEYDETDSDFIVLETESNEDPEIVDFTIEETEIAIGGSTQATIDAYDPQGSELTITWDIASAHDWSIDGQGETATIQAPNESGSTATVTVEVKDDFGGETSDFEIVSTKTSGGPDISDMWADDDPVDVQNSTMVHVEASDEDSEDLKYRWEIDSEHEWDIDDVDNDSTTLYAPHQPGSTVTVTVEVENEFEQSNFHSITVDTENNEDPVVDPIEPDEEELEVEQSLQLTVNATDPQNSALEYSWQVQSTDNWSIEDVNSDTTTLTAPHQPESNATVTVTVWDQFGGESTQTADYWTEDNDNPVLVEPIDPANIELDVEESLQLTVNATDPQNSALEYSWQVQSTDNWSIEDVDSDSTTLTAPHQPESNATVTVTVKDQFGGESTDTAEFWTEDNEDPEVKPIDPANVELKPAESLQLTVEADDPQNSELEYSWQVQSTENWSIEDLNNDSTTLTAPDQPESIATVTVTVRDQFGGESKETAEFWTEDNEGPNIDEQPWADPNPVAPDETTMVHVEASHPQGYELSYDWEALEADWTVSGDGSSVELTPVWAPSENSVVEVTVSDPYDESETVSTTVWTKDNVDPHVGNFTGDEEVFDLDPNDSEVNRTREVTIDAWHEYGFELSYNWSITGDGWFILEENGETVTVEAPHEPNSSATLSVEVTDDYDGFGEASTTLETLENSDPIITDVWTVDSPPFEREEWFEMRVLAEDPDGGDLSYTWTTEGAWDIFGQFVAEPDVQAPNHTEFEDIVLTIEDEWGFDATDTVEVRTYDYIPDDFSFDNVSGADPEVIVESNEVQITGLDDEISVEAVCYYECQLRHDQGVGDWTGWSSSHNGITEGTMVQIRKESGVFNQTVEANLEVGETVSAPWELATIEWEGTRTFSNCGQTGSSGPSQENCDDAYEQTLLEEKVSVDGGIQTWSAPATGVYELEALGAEGDSSTSGTDVASKGARAQGEISLDKGEEVQILIGQQGEYADWGDEDGIAVSGGGGTFVASLDDDPLVVAGGGGGIMRKDHPNRHGHDETHGKDGIDSEDSATSGGEDGDGGYPSGTHNGCDGGAGFYGNSKTDNAKSFVNGGGGGSSWAADGGFGGGGGARALSDSDYEGRCGGGGGYSGGGGVRNTSPREYECTGGGGGSFVDEELVDGAVLETGVNTGHGAVNVDWVGPQ